VTPAAPDAPLEGCISCETRGPVLLIGINRPAKLNGFTPRMFKELGEAYTRLDDDSQLRVGVLHAFGRHFTAGLDLPTIAPLMQRGEKAIPEGCVEPTDLGTPGYRRRTKPMVAAVKGITFTLGIELMLAADVVVAADEFDAAEALRLNFVQKVVPAGEELAEALRVAEAIAAQAPLAVVATRLNVMKAVEQGPLAAMQEFVDVQKRLSNSEDAAEGVRSFVEKRPAKFSGR
jgi:enoyl-CoA hydratase/carnithine racemase